MRCFFSTHLFLPASQHWDRLGPGYRSANLYELLGWGGYSSRAAGPPHGRRGRRDAGGGAPGWCSSRVLRGGMSPNKGLPSVVKA